MSKGQTVDAVDAVSSGAQAEPLGAGHALSISAIARRAGLAASALRFYEAQGLIRGSRSAGGQRQYPREVLRRLAFIRAGQQVGLSLDELRETLQALPEARTPTPSDWERLARAWQARLDERLALLLQLRNQLGSCIGCGCLSLKRCALYNPHDQAASGGTGPRFWLGQQRPVPAGCKE